MMGILNEINQSIKVKKDLIRDLEHSEKQFDKLQDNLEIIETEIRGLAYTNHVTKSSSCDKQVLTYGHFTNRNKLREIFKPIKRVKSENKQIEKSEINNLKINAYVTPPRNSNRSKPIKSAKGFMVEKQK